MILNPKSPDVLVSVRSEMEGAIIVEALAQRGIAARAIGSYTDGFRAEAPGTVNVVVAADDLAKARDVLVRLSEETAETDWSAVDCGDVSPVSTEETQENAAIDEKTGRDADSNRKRPFQFSIAQLLLLQLAVSIILSIWKGLPGAAAAVIFVVGGALALIVTGTVRIGSDLRRGRREIVYMMRVLGIGVLVFLASVAVLSLVQ